MNYLDGLNEKQKEAVMHIKGALLIIAGAGAGKTKTIAHRILHLIKNGVSPHEILAITFTNKSAKEMRERVNKLLSEDLDLNRPIFMNEKPFVSTFHSLGVHIIKENARLLGLTRHFSIFDQDDSLRTIKSAIKEANLDPKEYEPRRILRIISSEKGEGRNLAQFTENAGKNYFYQLISGLWLKYETTLKSEHALDFDDLLLKTVELLEKNQDIRKKYQNIWKYIHIDEYQDTNKIQYRMAKALTGENSNICVVGDIDQTIYSWRGADISHIMRFEKDFPGAKSVLLEQNYRSTKTILSAANQIIKKNKIRVEKNLFTENCDGEKIGLTVHLSEREEANFVAEKSKELISKGSHPQEISVLYRANFQSRILEEAMISHGVPYQVLGTRFFERKEVKDVLSFIRASLNPESISDLKRIINVPPRGIGATTILKIFSGLENDLPESMKMKLTIFRKMLSEIGESCLTLAPSEVIKYVIKKTGLEKELKEGTDEDKERLENIYELATLALKYDILPLGEGIEKLLEEASLASDQDELNKNQDAVKLMTVHSAKGLEFDFVFITGMESGLFPHKKIDEKRLSESEKEEERRLFYVAMTRARKKVWLSYAEARMIFGSLQINIPSEFLSDIDDSLIEAEERPKRTRRNLLGDFGGENDDDSVVYL